MDFATNRKLKNMQTLDEFTVIADDFLNNDKPISEEEIASLSKANESLKYTDDQGEFSPSSDLFKIERTLPFNPSKLYEAGKRDELKKMFYDIFAMANNAWRFMNNKHGDSSNTVPGTLKREMTIVAESTLQKLGNYYNETFASTKPPTAEELKSLQEEIRGKFQEVQKKADAYIAADMHTTANHMDTYEKLLRGMKSAVDGTETSVDGRLVQLVLSKMYPQEFEEYKKKYQEGQLEEMPIAVRNKIIELSNKNA